MTRGEDHRERGALEGRRAAQGIDEASSERATSRAGASGVSFAREKEILTFKLSRRSLLKV